MVTDLSSTKYYYTDYLNGFQYDNMNSRNGVYQLRFFPHKEGYVNNQLYGYESSPTFNLEYVYNHTDHLGNARLSYRKNGTSTQILEENNYYPFGLKHKGYNDNSYPTPYKYKYQGQERQDELGLNWDSFKWRNYDYAIGRFMSIDPLSEKYVYNSTYAFQENKMGLGRELEGLELWVQTNGSQSTPMYFANKDIGLKNNPSAIPMTADPLRGISQDSAGNISYKAGDTSVILHADGRQTQDKITYSMQDKTPYTDVRDQTMAMAFTAPLALPLALEIGVYMGISGAISGTSDALLQRAFKGSWSEVDVKQVGIAAVVKNPLRQFAAGSANNFLNSAADELIKGEKNKFANDLTANALKIGTGFIGMKFGQLGEATKNGLQGKILGSIMGNTFSNTTDAVTDMNNDQNKKKKQ